MAGIKGRFAPILLEGFKASRGKFTGRFWAGVVVAFFAKLTWEDIKGMFKTLDRNDWFSLATGFLFAIASVMATKGTAVVLLVSSLLLTLRHLAGDVALLGTCFLQCGDHLNILAGNKLLSSKVVALDSSQGEIQLGYSIPLDIPTRVWFYSEGNVIFQSPDATVGGNSGYAHIDRQEKSVTVKLQTQPGLRLSQRYFQVGCPKKPEVLCGQSFEQSRFQASLVTYNVGLDSSRGTIRLLYNMFDVPDRLDLIYESAVIFSTNGLVPGSNTITCTINGKSKMIQVGVRAPRSNTKWEFRLDCPRSN
mmetsp:Transcript_11971/g.33140  ORF Transcript_11971/g.33140 Transcript_11971/m.33140 type:complete len:306 (+) Transcript_11971:488-1405(+)